MISFERYGIWKFNADLPNQPIERITHDLSSLHPSISAGASVPKQVMVYNNKLYYDFPTKHGQIQQNANGTYYLNRAIFEYDPSLPLSVTNPRELTSGYELGGLENIPDYLKSDITLFDIKNDKLSAIGSYHTYDSSNGNRESYSGLIEYDLTRPIEYNDPSVLESNDNPKVIFGYDDYPVHLLIGGGDHFPLAFYADENEALFSAVSPQDINNPNYIKGNNGMELMFLNKQTNSVQEIDLCVGSCSSNPVFLGKANDQYIILANVINNGVEEKTIVVLKNVQGSLVLLHQFDTNLEGKDLSFDEWNFNSVEIDGVFYIPLLINNNQKNLFAYNTNDETMSGVFSDNLIGDVDSFSEIIKLNDKKIGFRFKRTDVNYVMGVFDTQRPPTTQSFTSPFANFFAKLFGFYAPFKEDDDYYYAINNVGGCPQGSLIQNSWNIVSMTKILDLTYQPHRLNFPDACNASVKPYTANQIVLIKD